MVVVVAVCLLFVELSKAVLFSNRNIRDKQKCMFSTVCVLIWR